MPVSMSQIFWFVVTYVISRGRSFQLSWEYGLQRVWNQVNFGEIMDCHISEGVLWDHCLRRRISETDFTRPNREYTLLPSTYRWQIQLLADISSVLFRLLTASPDSQLRPLALLYLKFLLITQHKVPFENTCESKKGRETENQKKTANATNHRSLVGVSTPFYTRTEIHSRSAHTFG